ncbi:hypothetical protein J4423_05090 [Candidatus Pacearchaeota archaeon]|nr:hypothetical protein [Candidatus Pacearchaeota archaeon]
MERRGDVDVMMYNLIYTAICISVFIGLFMYVNSYGRGSAFYEDFYSKEIINLINNAKPGMEFKIDITKLAMIAIKNGKPVKDIIYVNNVNNQITVSTRKDTGTSFGFFNDVDIVDWEVKNPSGSPETTQFIFKIKEKQRNEL